MSRCNAAAALAPAGGIFHTHTGTTEDGDMVITLFYSRFRKDLGEQGLAEYMEDAKGMRERAETFPGFQSIKTYTAEDGERLTVVHFDSPEQHGAWAADPEHLEAQQRGRGKYYQEYRLVICGKDREHGWEVGGTPREE